MSFRNRDQRFFVVDRLSGTVQYQELLGSWFQLSLVDRALFEAGVAGLGGTVVRPEVEAVNGSSETIVGWRVTLTSPGNGVVFRRDWTLEVLRNTALAVARQSRWAPDDNRVLYGVRALERAEGERSAGGRIEFEADREGAGGMATVPEIPVVAGPVAGRVIADPFPGDMVLALPRRALAAVLTPIRAGLGEDCEIAWAAEVQIARSVNDRTLVYRVTRLTRIASDDATAVRVPLDAGRLLAAVPAQERLFLLHTHLVPEDETADRRPFLAASWNDYRCMYRLKTGSLFGIVAGRLPFEIRLYGLGGNGVVELNARILLLDE